MHQCPRCRSQKIHASRTRSGWEAWRKQVTGKRPYRCSSCGWRGWAKDSGPQFSAAEIEASSRAIAPDPPNLKETLLAREKRQTNDVDLRKLDDDMSVTREAAEKR
jgi:hypothetical protein